ncbi:DUF2892 domain-containing protein [Candidatus Woesearchaeota archaeon]|nr:DUF2892 domain-containing protein [Candidatus Woesearchaeota archaeon]
MVQQNLDTVDRVLRFALAFWWLGPWAPSYWSWLNIVIAVIGWIALVESFWGFCWLHKWLGINRKK